MKTIYCSETHIDTHARMMATATHESKEDLFGSSGSMESTSTESIQSEKSITRQRRRSSRSSIEYEDIMEMKALASAMDDDACRGTGNSKNGGSKFMLKENPQPRRWRSCERIDSPVCDKLRLRNNTYDDTLSSDDEANDAVNYAPSKIVKSRARAVCI